MDSNLFRKKSITRVSSPDKLDDYIRVTTPSVWFALGAMVLLLIGALIWATCGELTIHLDDGTVQTVAPICLFLN